MADKHQLRIIKRGAEAWNAWRRENPKVVPDLSRADLSNQKLMAAHLRGANLEGVNFNRANLGSANLSKADLRHAKLQHTRLSQVNLLDADLSYADLSGAWLNDSILIEANFFRANLTDAKLINARLSGAILIGTNLQNANLKDSAVQSIFAWGIKMKGTNQTNLVVSHPKMPKIIVDNLEIAQLVHLRLYKENYSRHFNPIPEKIIVLLGHFSKTRSKVLANIQDNIRQHGFIPLKVDCDESTTPNFDTLTALTSLAQCIIVDATEPCAAMKTLQDIVFPLATPVHCILQQNIQVYDIGSPKPFLPEKFFSPLFYESIDDLQDLFETHIFPQPEEEVLV
ncbi:MAG: pentapeptide repeat-containing protein [bacterium]